MKELNDVLAIGTLIREKRKSQGLTQVEFAEAAGVGQRLISEIERGKETAEIGKVLHLINFAGIKLYAGDK